MKEFLPGIVIVSAYLFPLCLYGRYKYAELMMDNNLKPDSTRKTLLFIMNHGRMRLPLARKIQRARKLRELKKVEARLLQTAGNIYDNPELIDPSTIISFKTPYPETY